MNNTTRKPVAWAIVGEDNMVLDSHIYHTRSVAKRNAKEMQETLVPLYRDPPPPTLTDAEREALRMSIREWDESNDKAGWDVADTLRGLLARHRDGK